MLSPPRSRLGTESCQQAFSWSTDRVAGSSYQWLLQQYLPRFLTASPWRACVHLLSRRCSRVFAVWGNDLALPALERPCPRELTMRLPPTAMSCSWWLIASVDEQPYCRYHGTMKTESSGTLSWHRAPGTCQIAVHAAVGRRSELGSDRHGLLWRDLRSLWCCKRPGALHPHDPGTIPTYHHQRSSDTQLVVRRPSRCHRSPDIPKSLVVEPHRVRHSHVGYGLDPRTSLHRGR